MLAAFRKEGGIIPQILKERKENEMDDLEELESVQFILSCSVVATIIAVSYCLVEWLK